MLEVELQGPYSLLPAQTASCVFSQPDARGAGLFLWTFEHNRAHRIHYVAAAEFSIATANTQLISEIMLAERAVYDPEALEEGSLEILADKNSDVSARCAACDSAFSQLARTQVFFAISAGDFATDHLIAEGIIRKLVTFGDVPKAWLAASLHTSLSERQDQGLTIRFRRPAFIASLPDEMYL